MSRVFTRQTGSIVLHWPWEATKQLVIPEHLLFKFWLSQWSAGMLTKRDSFRPTFSWWSLNNPQQPSGLGSLINHMGVLLSLCYPKMINSIQIRMKNCTDHNDFNTNELTVSQRLGVSGASGKDQQSHSSKSEVCVPVWLFYVFIAVAVQEMKSVFFKNMHKNSIFSAAGVSFCLILRHARQKLLLRSVAPDKALCPQWAQKGV